MKNNNKISFVLDGEIVEIDFSKNHNLKPTTTVLNYLRSAGGHKSVKEGCAEGDCGACTIAVAELDGNQKLSYKSITSCIVFLPMIHGKQLITAENLSGKPLKAEELHPVQRAIVKHNGSQCGYCTPGVVMSMFVLYKNHQNPSRETIEDALTGNLCRCTGYNSILKAAEEACSRHNRDNFSKNENKIIEHLKSIKKNYSDIEIIADQHSYFRPSTIENALLLRRKHPEAIIINGASEIALRQTKHNEKFKMILDLSGLGELKQISFDEDYYRIGAGVSIEDLKNEFINEFPIINQALKYFGALQLRNLATIGGNIAAASPIGDTLPLLIALNAKLLLQNQNSERLINIADFIKSYRKTDIANDEIIREVLIPKPNNNFIYKFYKISKRKGLDISTVSACFSLNLDQNNIILKIVLVFGGMAAITKNAIKTEEFLTGKSWNINNIKKAGEILYNEFEPIGDARAEAETRKIAVKNLLLKFYSDINS
ncbi:MAG: xanthine dehydrogenase small subunit [Bacteroidales bacterium]|nr:xanthine dehydrogenase small subunit [Bacteroidales bacterium]